MFGIFGHKTLVGIDIGHYAIKIAQVERVGQTWKVSRLIQVRTPQDAIKESVVIDADAIGYAIKQAMREGGFSANGAVIAVSGGSVVVRQVRIPKMTEATLRKSIKFEASRYVPNSVEDSFIEFEILGDVDDLQMDVLIVAAPRDVVESRIKACQIAGLDVECVDVEPFAAFRSLFESDPASDVTHKNVVLIDIGGATTSMSVIQGGSFAMARSLPQGGQTLTDALKNYFKLSEEDAESGKAQLNLNELLETAPKENPPLRVVQPHLDDMIREVRRSLNYFQSQGVEGGSSPGQRNVDLVVLSGGGAKMAGLAEYVSHKLGMTTVTMGLFDNTTFENPFESMGSGLDLAVATGLAMRAA